MEEEKRTINHNYILLSNSAYKTFKRRLTQAKLPYDQYDEFGLLDKHTSFLQ